MPKAQIFVQSASRSPSAFGDSLVAEGYVRSVVDNTPTNPAVAGKLLACQFASTNVSGTGYAQNATATAVLPAFTYGIVVTPAQVMAQQGTTQVRSQAEIIQAGPAQALCTTGTTAISPGTLLVADANGNLTPAGATPAAGTILAVSLGSLPASTSTPTLVPVMVANA
jgi:hypothetical protein